MIHEENLVPGKYYRVEFATGSVFTVKAISRRWVETIMKNGIPYNADGTIGDAIDIQEISSVEANRNPTFNEEAVFCLQKEDVL